MLPGVSLIVRSLCCTKENMLWIRLVDISIMQNPCG